MSPSPSLSLSLSLSLLCCVLHKEHRRSLWTPIMQAAQAVVQSQQTRDMRQNPIAFLQPIFRGGCQRGVKITTLQILGAWRVQECFSPTIITPHSKNTPCLNWTCKPSRNFSEREAHTEFQYRLHWVAHRAGESEP